MTIEPVRKSIEVGVGPDEAFRIFTDNIDDWWPLTSHSIHPCDACECVFEDREGGRVYETCRDGSIRLWGVVTAWDPVLELYVACCPG